MRVGAVVLSALGAAWIAFGAQPWELVPFRDEPRPRAGSARRGARDRRLLRGLPPVRACAEPGDARARPLRDLRLRGCHGAVRRGAPAARRSCGDGRGRRVARHASGRQGDRRRRGRARRGARDPADPARDLGAHGAGRRSHRRARRRRSGVDVVGDHARARRRGRLGDLGHPRAGAAGERGAVHLGLELRGHRASRPRRPSYCVSTGRARRTTGERRRSTSSTRTTGSSACSGSSRSTTTPQTLQLPQLIPAAGAEPGRAGSSSGFASKRSWTTTSPPPARRSRSTDAASARCSCCRVACCAASTPVGEGESYRVWSYAPDPAPRSSGSSAGELPVSRRRASSRSTGARSPRSGYPGASASFVRCSTIRRTRVSRVIGPCTTKRGVSRGRHGRRTQRCSHSSRGSARRAASPTTSRHREGRALRSSRS